MRPKHFVIRFLSPILWRFLPQRKAYFLQDFAIAELDSCWQSLRAIPQVKDSKLKVHLFHHAVEEMHHSNLFRKLTRHYSSRHLKMPMLRRQEIIFDSEKRADLLDFLAYVHVGEKEVNVDFAQYAKAAKPDPMIQETFRRIQEDEERHEHDTVAWMHQTLGLPTWRIRLAIFRQQLRLSWNAYKNMMMSVGRVPFTGMLLVAYALLGLPAALSARKRMGISADAELEIFRQQLARKQREFEPASATPTRGGNT